MLVYIFKTMASSCRRVRKRDILSILILIIVMVVLSHNERFDKSIFYETFPRTK